MSGADRGGDPTEPGSEEWAFETGDRVTFSPTVVDGTVYVGRRDRSLYAVDAASGTEEWAFETRGADVSSPTVADETVYIGSAGSLPG
jgi:outer membrane protein assembly factor BamB